jgi:hypothetical protein
VAVPEEADADVRIDTDVHLALVGRTLKAGDRASADGEAQLQVSDQGPGLATDALDSSEPG